MATVVVAGGYAFANIEDESDGIADITVTSASLTQIVLTEPSIIGTYTGTFTVTALTVAGISGTITAYQQTSLDGTTQFTITGLSKTWSETEIGNTIQSDDYAGADSIVGADLADTIRGYASDDTISGGAGTDIIYGNQGADRLFGNDGADTMFGGQDADVIYGNAGNDVLYGNGGADTVYGGQSDDVLYGGQDSDVLYGNLGTDFLYGGVGNDTIFGGQGDDLLDGGGGDDLLRGGLGSDTFGVGSGNDSIADFDTVLDRLQSASARVSAVDTADGALLTYANGATVTLIGVSASAVTDTTVY